MFAALRDPRKGPTAEGGAAGTSSVYNSDAHLRVAGHNANSTTMAQVLTNAVSNHSASASSPYQPRDPGVPASLHSLIAPTATPVQFSPRTITTTNNVPRPTNAGDHAVDGSVRVHVTSTNNALGMACLQDAEACAFVIRGMLSARCFTWPPFHFSLSMHDFLFRLFWCLILSTAVIHLQQSSDGASVHGFKGLSYSQIAAMVLAATFIRSSRRCSWSSMESVAFQSNTVYVLSQPGAHSVEERAQNQER